MKNKMKWISLVLALVFALALTGCAKTQPAKEVNVPVADIATDLLSMENQFGAMTDFGQETLTDLYGIDFSLLAESSMNDAMMNIKSHILYVVKVNDEKDIDTVKAQFKTRLEAMQQNFSTYLPDQYDLAMDGKLENNGKYVILVVSEDSQAVLDRFNELLSQAE